MYSAIAANKRNTFVIVLLFIGLISALGWLLGMIYHGNYTITLGLFIGSILYALFQYFAADKIALSVNGARQISKQDDPRLYRVVENLSIATGSPMPKVFIIDDAAPNAFATGRAPQHASVTATRGLLDIMDDSELEAVMAHELGHVRNYDIRVMTIVFGLVSAVGLIADMLLRTMWFTSDDEDNVPPVFLLLGVLAGLLAPFVAMMVQLAVSRQREYLADATSAMTTRYPEGLVRALEKIEGHGSALQRQNSSTAHLFFANPLKGRSLAALFSTHPPTADRIKRLREMETKL